MYAQKALSVTAKTAQWLIRRSLHLLLPRCCLGCEAPLWADRLGLGLCPDCQDDLLPWPEDGCGVCQRPLEGAELPSTYRCNACRLEPPPYERSLSAWSYEPPLDAVLQAFKFRRLRYLGPPLARLAALRLQEQLADIDVVVPVPLHWRRRLQRGFNQAEILADAVAQVLGRPCRRALKRQRSTPAQSLLSKTDRRRNLTGAFALSTASICHRRQVLLVDDVLTTGATVETAARVLLRAQPARLTVLTMARTPANGESLKPRNVS